MKTKRLLLGMAFMGLFLFGANLFAQQETDPSWYDPWTEPAKTTSQPPAPLTASYKGNSEAAPAASKLRTAKLSRQAPIAASKRTSQPEEEVSAQQVVLEMPKKQTSSGAVIAKNQEQH
jgi:hypothetical protein